MDWNSDPEMKAIRDEFIASFDDRLEILRKGVAQLKSGDAEALKNIQYVAHKIAGTAESYGFPSLTRIGALIDDLLDKWEKAGSTADSHCGMSALQ